MTMHSVFCLRSVVITLFRQNSPLLMHPTIFGLSDIWGIHRVERKGRLYNSSDPSTTRRETLL